MNQPLSKFAIVFRSIFIFIYHVYIVLRLVIFFFVFDLVSMIYEQLVSD